jgi:hypothetical protein
MPRMMTRLENHGEKKSQPVWLALKLLQIVQCIKVMQT